MGSHESSYLAKPHKGHETMFSHLAQGTGEKVLKTSQPQRADQPWEQSTVHTTHTWKGGLVCQPGELGWHVHRAGNSQGAAVPTQTQPCGPAKLVWASGSQGPAQSRLSLCLVPQGMCIMGKAAARPPPSALPLNSDSNFTCTCGCQASVSDVFPAFVMSFPVGDGEMGY